MFCYILNSPDSPITVRNYMDSKLDCFFPLSTNTIPPNPENTVFVFPSSKKSHEERTQRHSLFSIGRDKALTQIAKALERRGITTLSLPIDDTDLESDRTVVEAAMRDLWEALGRGLTIMLPVRVHSNSNYFKAPLPGCTRCDTGLTTYEPCFWEAQESNPALAKFYSDELDRIVHFAQLEILDKVPTAYLDAYKQGQAKRLGSEAVPNELFLIQPTMITDQKSKSISVEKTQKNKSTRSVSAPIQPLAVIQPTSTMTQETQVITKQDVEQLKQLYNTTLKALFFKPLRLRSKTSCKLLTDLETATTDSERYALISAYYNDPKNYESNIFELRFRARRLCRLIKDAIDSQLLPQSLQRSPRK